MNILSLILILIIGQSSWGRITPPEENFSLKLPYEMTFIKKTEKNQTAIGSLELTIYQSSDKDEYDNVFVASYLGYSEDLALVESLKDSLLLASIEDLPGETMYSAYQEQMDYSFYTIRKNLPEQSLSIKAKVFFIENKLYMILVYSHEDKMLNSNIDYYLNSFRVETSKTN